MPERKGVLNIIDDNLRRPERRRPSLPRRNSICNIPEVSPTAKQGPVPPKRAGAHSVFGEPLGRRRAQSYACELFQRLECAFAPTFSRLPPRVKDPRSEAPPGEGERAGFGLALSDLNGLRPISQSSSRSWRLRGASRRKDSWGSLRLERRSHQSRIANETGEERPSRLSEKQYQRTAGLARNCRFFLIGRTRPSWPPIPGPLPASSDSWKSESESSARVNDSRTSASCGPP